MNWKRREMLCFLIVGCSAVLTDYLCYQVFMKLFLWDQSVSKGISFFCGALLGFILNKFWTFQSSRTVKKEVPKYILLYMCTALINAQVNAGILFVMQSEPAGFLGATGVSTILNFIGQKFFVFTKGKEYENVNRDSVL